MAWQILLLVGDGDSAQHGIVAQLEAEQVGARRDEGAGQGDKMYGGGRRAWRIQAQECIVDLQDIVDLVTVRCGGCCR